MDFTESGVVTIITRVNKLRQRMEKGKMDAFLVSKPENIRYLSGFTGGSDARLLVSLHQQFILTDSRYLQQAAIESPHWHLVEEKPPGFEQLTRLSSKFTRMGVESDYITHQAFKQLEKTVSPELVPTADFIEDLRVVKDESELKLLQQAAKIGDSVFTDILEIIKPGVSERFIANQINYLLKEKGCERESFDIIAVAGENAALPHGRPGLRNLQAGDMLTMDYGGFYQGYAGDMTRTVVIGEASPTLKGYYMAVLEAQQLGVSLVKAGSLCRDIDQAVRDCLKKYNLDIYFQHSTGHGVGLEIHEKPAVSLRSEVVLQENMVITIEPGIYIPGWGGIRIEDTVMVKKGGSEIITHSDKNLIIL